MVAVIDLQEDALAILKNNVEKKSIYNPNTIQDISSHLREKPGDFFPEILQRVFEKDAIELVYKSCGNLYWYGYIMQHKQNLNDNKVTRDQIKDFIKLAYLNLTRSIGGNSIFPAWLQKMDSLLPGLFVLYNDFDGQTDQQINYKIMQSEILFSKYLLKGIILVDYASNTFVLNPLLQTGRTLV